MSSTRGERARHADGPYRDPHHGRCRRVGDPFGHSQDLAGMIAVYGVDTGNEHPPSPQIIDALSSSFKQKAEAREVRAVAICFDVRVVPPKHRDKVDAICVSLEHEGGETMDVFEPYQKKWFGRIGYGELFASEREAQFFRRS